MSLWRPFFPLLFSFSRVGCWGQGWMNFYLPGHLDVGNPRHNPLGSSPARAPFKRMNTVSRWPKYTATAYHLFQWGLYARASQWILLLVVTLTKPATKNNKDNYYYYSFDIWKISEAAVNQRKIHPATRYRHSGIARKLLRKPLGSGIP